MADENTPPLAARVELTGVSAIGLTGGAGIATGVGASIAAAVGNPAGGPTFRQDTPLTLRSDAATNIGISPPAAQLELNQFHSPTVSITPGPPAPEATASSTSVSAVLSPILAEADQSITIGQTATATVTEQANAKDQTDAVTLAPLTVNATATVGDPPNVIAFEILEARVFALESALLAIHEQRSVGIGHNRGPDIFKPWSANDEQEIRHLVVLLKQQTPATVVQREELAAAADKATKVAEKIREYADDFFKAAAKKGGEKFGERIFSPTWWLGMALTISLVVEAVSSWLSLFGSP